MQNILIFKYNKLRIHGFAMVEMIVSVAIILLVLPGILSSVTRAVSFGSVQKDELTATYLAQECLEIVRTVRDQNVLTKMAIDAGAPGTAPVWNENFDGTAANENKCKFGCSVDAIAAYGSSILPAPPSTKNVDDYSQPLNVFYHLYRTEQGLYTVNSAGVGTVPTPFYRELLAVKSTGGDEIELVKCVVAWDTAMGRKKVVYSEMFTRWMQ